jgi:hypothetical protein
MEFEIAQCMVMFHALRFGVENRDDRVGWIAHVLGWSQGGCHVVIWPQVGWIAQESLWYCRATATSTIHSGMHTKKLIVKLVGVGTEKQS